MIYDTLANLPRYRGIHPNLDRAIDYLCAHDVAALPNGHYEPDGDRVMVNVMDAAYRAPEDARFEAHRLYADLQISLTGDESIGWRPLAECPNWAKDAETHVFEEPLAIQALLPMRKGTFTLVFPQDAHAPGIGQGTGRKAVVKIRMDQK